MQFLYKKSKYAPLRIAFLRVIYRTGLNLLPALEVAKELEEYELANYIK